MTGVTVIVDDAPVAPLLKLTGDVAVNEKSFAAVKVKDPVVVCEAVPGEPDPVIPTLNVLVVVDVHVRLEVPVPLAVRVTGVTVNGLQVSPAGTLSVRETVPAKLNVLVRVIVEVNEEPTEPVGEVAEIVKSPT